MLNIFPKLWSRHTLVVGDSQCTLERGRCCTEQPKAALQLVLPAWDPGWQWALDSPHHEGTS